MRTKHLMAPASVVVVLLAMAIATPAWAESNALMAWGSNQFGQLGIGSTTNGIDVPVEVKGMHEVAAVASGGTYTLALNSEKTVEASGLSETGQLGTGPSGATKTNTFVPVCAVGTTEKCVHEPEHYLRKVKEIASSGSTSLALLENGEVVAWGGNREGALGDGTETGPEQCPVGEELVPCSRVPVPVQGLKEVKAISAGASNMALVGSSETGEVRVWGSNISGTLGNGTTIPSDVPIPVKLENEQTHVDESNNVKAISSGAQAPMALLGSGEHRGDVMTWGQNFYHQLGLGVFPGPETCTVIYYCSTHPKLIEGLSEVTAIEGKEWSQAALLKNGTVKDWGNNYYGELCNGEASQDDGEKAVRNAPALVTGLSNVVSLGSDDFSRFAVLANGNVVACGSNRAGQLGIGKESNYEYVELPVEVHGLSEASYVGGRGSSSFAIQKRPGPQFYVNGEPSGTEKWPTLNGGELTLESKELGKITCRVVANGTVTNATERGRAKIDAFVASPCSSASCPGIVATAEKPIELVEVERENAKKEREKVKVAKRGASTLPWSAELVKTSEPASKLKLERMGITLVVPPCKGNPLVEGGGEFFFEGTLEPSFINGIANGLSPSRLGFGRPSGELIDSSLPETEKENALALESTGTPVKLAGESAFELITAR